jgi:hypothetical protein
MADDFPESLQQYAVPPASKNMAGQKVPGAKARRRSAVKAQPPRTGEPDIHDQLAMISGGAIKHSRSGESPYATGEAVAEPSELGPVKDPDIPEDFDPFDVTPPAESGADRKISPQEAALRKQAVLQELGVPARKPADDTGREAPATSVRTVPASYSRTQECGPRDKYLMQSQRIQLELADGTFTLPVIDVRESRLSVLLLLPLRDNATIFIPRPGTKMTLTYGKENKAVSVYYPGTYVEIEELGAGFMTLIKADAEPA